MDAMPMLFIRYDPMKTSGMPTNPQHNNRKL
jgi:hypothetical protein